MGELSRQASRLRVEVANADVDMVSGDLWAAGTIGIEELSGSTAEHTLLVAGFENAASADRAAAALGRFSVIEEVGGGRYLDMWREHASAHRAGNRIVIKPPWVDYEAGPVELVLHIEPGQSFGSGSHPSTRVALALLEQLLEGDEEVLDVGCGSGVLAVGSARLGATAVVGIDIDPDAPRLTAENARRNGVSDLVTSSTMPLTEVEGEFDVVVANILAAALVELGADLVGRVRPGGRLVLAGLLRHQIQMVTAACHPLELLVERDAADENGQWVGLVLGEPSS